MKKTFIESFHILQTSFKGKCLSRSICYKWFKSFREGRSLTAGDPLSGAQQFKLMTIITVFVNSRGIVYKAFLFKDETINRFYYFEILRHLRQTVRKKRLETWANMEWVLYYENASAHYLFLIRNFCIKNAMTVIPQPFYSPNLVSANFFLLPN